VNNDEYGADGAGCVLSVTVGGKTYDVAETGTTTINGTYGVLKIQSSGQYTYTANDGATTQDVRDTFGYTIKDGDGDTSSAILAVNVSQVADPDYTPEINNSGKTVDETNFEDGMLMASGKLAVDYKGDEAGSVDPNGAFNISNGDLTSCDKPVTITSDTNGYTGTRADGVVVFTLTVQDNGSYKYTQFEAIDHPNTDDANDALTMRFGVTATDGDGDTDTATIAIKVLDDGPTISTKGHGLYESSKDAGGVLVRTGTMPHDFGQDGAGTIESNGNFAAKFQVGGQDQTLTSAGDEIFVTQTSTGYVGKLAGGKTVFKIDIDAQTGEFEYKQYEPVDHPDTSSSSEAIWLKFGVTITDKDGDTDDATMMIDLHDDGPDAKNDTKSGDSDGNISGNVTDNDDYGYDDAGSVIKVTFEGTTLD